MSAEQNRLDEYETNKKNWLKWGSYLSERQWGTVREDYSPSGDAWNYFPHHQAMSRVYRWGEDGIAGISDENQYLCFALAMWNGKDPILKERMYGLTNGEGNHGEDVKELYYYLSNTPTHSYMKHLYKYPQGEYPYNQLVSVNAKRTKLEREYEILDTTLFDNNKYFDVQTEYAKADEEDILIKITITNRAEEAATLHLLPTLWFRNTWKYNLTDGKVGMELQADGKSIVTVHPNLEPYYFYFEAADKVLFTENKNNKNLLFGTPDKHPFRKDSFHTAVINNDYDFLSEKKDGTKAAPLYVLEMEALQTTTIFLRLSNQEIDKPFNDAFENIFEIRKQEAAIFYTEIIGENISEEQENLRLQSFASMLWSKQYYYYDVNTWLNGDVHLPATAPQRLYGRNANWLHFKAADIISMPDKWEYPWFAAWDLAFHSMALAAIDISFAKKQLLLLFGDNYFNTNGQLPAYEWNFSDVNPPVQAIAALEICRIEQLRFGKTDYDFLQKIFPLLLQNYNWWLTQKDDKEHSVFEGGFLGLDNVSVFDRSHGLPEGGKLYQADGTAWMAMFSLNLLEIALILTKVDKKYDEHCIKFFNEFVKIADSLQAIAKIWQDVDTWDDGFFYDVLALADGRHIPVKLRSIAGIIPMLASCSIHIEQLNNAPLFAAHLHKFNNINDFYQIVDEAANNDHIMLSLLTPFQLQALLPVLFNEGEMLAPGGIRSMSKIYENGFVLDIDGVDYGLKYLPAESDNNMYGGNSNWRGPVWMPLNYLIVRALKSFESYYHKDIQFSFNNNLITLSDAADELSSRLLKMFLPNENGYRPIHGGNEIYKNEHFKNLILFYEHFDAENGRGVGASHQTGWTGLAALL